MIVRDATQTDRLGVVGLLKARHAEEQHPFPFSAVHIDAAFSRHCQQPFHFCAVLAGERVDGVLMAYAYEHPRGYGLCAAESDFYIRPAARGRHATKMLDAYEKWARALGCKAVNMASLTSFDVSPLYRRRGYEPAETHFIKYL